MLEISFYTSSLAKEDKTDSYLRQQFSNNFPTFFLDMPIFSVKYSSHIINEVIECLNFR